MLERNQGTEKGEEYYGARAEAHLSHIKGHIHTGLHAPAYTHIKRSGKRHTHCC